jgi:hypothetical protein
MMTATARFEDLLAEGKIIFDFNGHFRNRQTQPKIPKDSYLPVPGGLFRSEEIFRDEVFHLLRVSFLRNHSGVSNAEKRIAKKLPCIDPKLFEKKMISPGKKAMVIPTPYNLRQCSECGDKFVFTFNGRTVKVKDPCRYPDGAPPFTVTIPCPSGVLVFANYFHFAESSSVSHAECLARVEGLKYETRHYAKQGIAHAFCGNSCPGIFLNQGNDYLIVGRQGENGEFPGYRKVAHVVTDLWAWSAVDLNLLQKQVKKHRTKENGLSMKAFDQRVRVKPGKYRVTQRIHTIDRDDRSRPQRFATLKWVS